MVNNKDRFSLTLVNGTKTEYRNLKAALLAAWDLDLSKVKALTNETAKESINIGKQQAKGTVFK